MREDSQILFGIPVVAATLDDAAGMAERAIRARERMLIGVVNAAKIVKMRHDRELCRAVLAADAIFADGMSVVWASRMLRRSLPERVTGIDLMHRLLEYADAERRRVYCLGATTEILDRATAYIRANHSGVQLVGTQHGYYAAEGEEAVVRAIAAARPDILFVAMSSPRKELFMAQWGEALAVPVCHGVGGSFDVIAGKVRRAPAVWQRLGMEWLYRLIQEPRRLFWRYMHSNTVFAGMVLAQFVGRGDVARRNGVGMAARPRVEQAAGQVRDVTV